MKLAFVFPGQGSQKVGMTDWVSESAAANDVIKKADQALGEDLSELIRNGPEELLSLTVNTQPALLAAGYALYCAWLEKGGLAPEMAAGHSLGEYTALTAAGVFDIADAVRLVRFRAKAMQSAVAIGVGGMAAILGLDDETVAAICQEAKHDEVVEPVNFNCPGQVVIAGHKVALERVCALAQEKGAKRAVMLAVSAPFHSSLLIGAARELAVKLADTEMHHPKFPVVANVDLVCHDTPESIRESLALQAARPVQWAGCVRKMQEAGITHIVECGPGRVLAGLIRRIAPEITVLNISDVVSIDAALAALEQ